MGKRNKLILMLAIVYRGIAISSFGHCLINVEIRTKERIALIQRFIAILVKTNIECVEFIGEQWFTWLIEQDINFCIRVKKTSTNQN